MITVFEGVTLTGTATERAASVSPAELTRFVDSGTAQIYEWVGGSAGSWILLGSVNQSVIALSAGTASIGLVGLIAGVQSIGTVIVLPTDGATTDLSGTIAVAATSQLLSAAKTRKYVFFQNNSTAALTINFTAAATAANPSIVVAAGGSFVQESSYVTNEAINVYGATAGQAFTYKEA